MSLVIRMALALAILSPLAGVAVVGVRVLLGDRQPGEATTAQAIATGLIASVLASLAVLWVFLGITGQAIDGDIEFGDWLRIGDFVIPAVLRVDGISVTISVFASVLTALIARFSRTYLHKEPGFVRFFVLLGLFATGTQLVALAGALELFFAGWEIIGISSAFFIGFFHERGEPVRSSIRALPRIDSPMPAC